MEHRIVDIILNLLNWLNQMHIGIKCILVDLQKHWRKKIWDMRVSIWRHIFIYDWSIPLNLHGKQAYCWWENKIITACTKDGIRLYFYVKPLCKPNTYWKTRQSDIGLTTDLEGRTGIYPRSFKGQPLSDRQSVIDEFNRWSRTAVSHNEPF